MRASALCLRMLESVTLATLGAALRAAQDQVDRSDVTRRKGGRVTLVARLKRLEPKRWHFTTEVTQHSLELSNCWLERSDRGREM